MYSSLNLMSENMMDLIEEAQSQHVVMSRCFTANLLQYLYVRCRDIATSNQVANATDSTK